MSEEKKKILEMLKNGEISVDEADKLLESLGTDAQSTALARKKDNLASRFIRIQVNSQSGDNVRVNLPLSLAKVGMSFIPQEAKVEMESHGVNLESIIEAIEQGADGELVNIEASSGEVVRIYLD
jgi:hypothetical protein